MLRPRLEVLSLRYGCHEGEWTIAAADGPVVIAGPNGSGKSTLIDGLVRTLFGFDRRRGEDAAEQESREPWGRDGMRGRVVVARNGDRVEIRRDFRTDRVRVYAPDEGVEHFDGDGNPGARNQEATHYRQILTDLLGLRDLDAYRQTLFIRQGDLPEDTLGEHLLRVAAGGHARVDAARHQIAQAHRTTTRRPLHDGAAAAINPRELEKLDEEIASVRNRLRAAQTAGERRAPLALDRDRVADRLATLDEEIVLLEDALTALARTGATEIGTRHVQQQIRALGDAATELRAARDELDDARQEERQAFEAGAYPDDLPERLARAELRWHDLEELDGPPAPLLGIAALLLLAAVAGALAAGYPIAAGVSAGVGALTGVAWTALWGGARRRRKHAKREIDTLLSDLPGAETLGPENTGSALEAHQKQTNAARRVAAAREALADALRHARPILQDSDLDRRGDSEAGDHVPTDRPSRLLDRLELAVEAGRERLARSRVELDRIGDLSLALPADVAPTEESVAAALKERRGERAKAQESLRDVSQELMERGTPSESVEALEGLLSSLEPRRDALDRKAEVLEAAHALILDAYDEFRDRDQDRLADRVSEHVHRLSDGRLDSILVDGSLDEARVRTRGRVVPMRTPPLSFGEYHALQLGVRLGAAEFLAGMGILPPLIIDEPFAHLDRDRAASVWRILLQVARDRQVILTTQDEPLLDDLGVSPNIRLDC